MSTDPVPTEALGWEHKKDCPFRRAMERLTLIACDRHGYDVCPVCDRCNCIPGAHACKAADENTVQPPVPVEHAQRDDAPTERRRQRDSLLF